MAAARQPLGDDRRRAPALADIKKAASRGSGSGSEVIAEALGYLLGTHPEFTATRRGHARILGQIAFAHATSGAKAGGPGYLGRSLVRWPAAPQAHRPPQRVTGIDPRLVLQSARVLRRGLA